MAQKITLVDDLDGVSDAAETFRYAFDGVEYELDLSEKNGEKFRKTLSSYIEKSRRVGGRAKRGTATATAPAKKSTSSGPNRTKKIREWALENGIEVSDRGRIPANVIEQYEQAH